MRNNRQNQNFHKICETMDAVRGSIDIGVFGGAVATACELRSNGYQDRLLKVPAYVELSYAGLVFLLLFRKLFTDYQGTCKQGLCLAAIDYKTLFRLSTAFLSVFSGSAILTGLAETAGQDSYLLEIGLVCAAFSIFASRNVANSLPHNPGADAHVINAGGEDENDAAPVPPACPSDLSGGILGFALVACIVIGLQLPILLLGAKILSAAGHEPYEPFYHAEGVLVGGVASLITASVALFSLLLPSLSLTDCLTLNQAEIDAQEGPNVPSYEASVIVGSLFSGAVFDVSPAISAWLLQSSPGRAMAAFWTGFATLVGGLAVVVGIPAAIASACSP